MDKIQSKCVTINQDINILSAAISLNLRVFLVIARFVMIK